MESYSIADAPGEILLYIGFMGLFHAAIVIAGLLLALPLLLGRKRRYLVFVRGFFVFNALLLVVSAMLNALWSCTIWGSLYFSTDYVVDFSPFWPITKHLIDMPFGDMTGRIFLGLNIRHVQAVWFAFAFAAWTTAVFLYSRFRRFWTKRNLEQEGSCDALPATDPQRST